MVLYLQAKDGGSLKVVLNVDKTTRKAIIDKYASEFDFLYYFDFVKGI